MSPGGGRLAFQDASGNNIPIQGGMGSMQRKQNSRRPDNGKRIDNGRRIDNGNVDA